MSVNVGSPFLEELRQRWESGQIDRDSAVKNINEWVQDPIRTDDELAEAWRLQNEVEDSTGLDGPDQLLTELNSDPAGFISEVMASLQEISSRGHLDDDYALVLEAVVREGGPSFGRDIEEMLSNGKTDLSNNPALKAIWDGLTGDKGQDAPDPTADELLAMLDSDPAQHIPEVLSSLWEISDKDNLDDTYLPVLEAVVREGDESNRVELAGILRNIPDLNSYPNLQAILDQLATDERDPGADQDPAQGAAQGPAQGQGQVQRQGQRRGGPKANGAGPVSPGGDYWWKEANRLINLGRWDEARQAVSKIPPDDRHATEISSMLDGIKEREIYDLVPGLRDYLGKLSSSRNRRDWKEFETRVGEAERLVNDASGKEKKTLHIPGSLQKIINVARDSQDAEDLYAKAVTDRKNGEFAQAANKLTSAVGLDPHYMLVQAEQATVNELQSESNRLDTLADSSKTQDLADAVDLADKLLARDAAPNSTDIRDKRRSVVAKINGIVERTRRRIDSQQEAINTPDSIENKIARCGSIIHLLEQIEIVHKDDLELEATRDEIEKTQRELENLKVERDQIAKFVTDLRHMQTGGGMVPGQLVPLDVTSVEQWLLRLAKLARNPKILGDKTTEAISTDLLGVLTAYLDAVLLGMAQGSQTIDLTSLQNAHQVLQLARTVPNPLPTTELDRYSRLIWSVAGVLVRSLLPKSLPPAGNIGGQPSVPRASFVIASWDHAQRVLSWLGALPDAFTEQQTIEALERDFALSITHVYDDTAKVPAKATPEEQQESVISARVIKQHVKTLPLGIADKLPERLTQDGPIEVEKLLQKRRRLGAVRATSTFGMVLILLGVFVAALWPRVAPVMGVVFNPPTPMPEPTLTPEIKPPISQQFEPEPDKGSVDCVYENGFNVCDVGNRKFKQWYSENKDFLGRPISRAFEDTEISMWAQYFEMGRLEWSTDENGSRPTLGLIGADVMKKWAGLKPALVQAQKEVSKPSVDCRNVPGYPHWICGAFGDFYTKSVGQRDPVSLYGLPISEEYQDALQGKPFQRQFFQRAIFQLREGKVERLPLGILYINWVRENGMRNSTLPLPDYLVGLVDPADANLPNK